MKGGIGLVAVFGLFAGVTVLAQDAAKPPAAAEDHVNIEKVRELDAKGGYIRLDGKSLFLTSDVAAKDKPQQPGFWFDITADPSAPVLVDKALPAGWDLAVVGDYAFLCDYTPALTVASLKERKWTPVLRLPMPNNTENIVVRGKLAYVATHSSGLTIVDIADPEKPAIVGKLNPKIDCDGIALWKDYAVLYAHWESRLVLVDITDPAKPVQAGLYQHDKGSFNQGEVRVADGFAYCSGVNGLTIVDIRDAANPKLAAAVEIRNVTDVEVMDGYVFVAARAEGVRVLDVMDPTKPVEAGRYVDKAHLSASEVAVEKAAPAAPGGAASYFVYVANRAGSAAVLRFQPPARTKNSEAAH